jgi:hypothetical protein
MGAVASGGAVVRGGGMREVVGRWSEGGGPHLWLCPCAFRLAQWRGMGGDVREAGGEGDAVGLGPHRRRPSPSGPFP